MKQRLFYGVPSLSALPYIRENYTGIVVNAENELNHSTIFLREVGFPVYINGIMSTYQNSANCWESSVCGFSLSTHTTSPSRAHRLPVSLWRTEFSVFDGVVPGGQDYLSALKQNITVRLFDFSGDKSLPNSQYLSILQRQTLALLPDLKVLVPHCESVKALLHKGYGAMLESETACRANIVPHAGFVYVGCNDLLRSGANLEKCVERVAKDCIHYEKELVLCGENCFSARFLQKCSKWGVKKLCISECSYQEVVKNLYVSRET